jgi:hypothetical protein
MALREPIGDPQSQLIRGIFIQWTKSWKSSTLGGFPRANGEKSSLTFIIAIPAEAFWTI